MKRTRIPIYEVQRLAAAGQSVSEIAGKLGHTKGGISRILKRLRVATSKDVCLRAAPQVVEKGLDVMTQLSRINEHARWLVEHLMSWAKGEVGALQVLENQVKTVRVGAEKIEVKEVKLKDPRELALKAMAEVRQQLEFQAGILKSLYGLQEAMRFREIVLQEIGTASVELRDKILKRLAEQNVIVSSLSLPGALPGAVDLEARLRHAEALRRRSPELQQMIDEVIDDGQEE